MSGQREPAGFNDETGIAADSEDKAQRILNAAVRVFSTRGFVNSTVEDVAREAGVGKGTVYLYYASKDQLLEEVMTQALTGFLCGLKRLREKPGSLRLKIEQVFEYSTNYARQNRNLAQFMVEDGPNFGGRFRQRFQVLREEIETVLTDIVVHGLNEADLSTSKRHVVALIGGAITSCVSHELLRARSGVPEVAPLDATVLADILWRGISAANV